MPIMFRPVIQTLHYRLFTHTNHVRNFQLIGKRTARQLSLSSTISSERKPKSFEDVKTLLRNDTKASIFNRESNVDELLEDEEDFQEDHIYDREFANLKLDDFEELYKNDESGEIKDKIATILAEYDYHKYNSLGRVPSTINLITMEQILNEGSSPNLRTKVFNLLFKREMYKRREKIKKDHKRTLREEKLKLQDDSQKERTGLLDKDGNLVYGLWHNSLFIRFTESKLKSGNSLTRLKNASLFGRKLIFDFDYEQYMVQHTFRNCVDQVQETYGLNRFHYEDPFDLWFCNFNDDSELGRYVLKHGLPNLYTNSMITVKRDCFTNHFDKSRLVYLSPHARESLVDVNNEDTYIIGVFNDKGNAKPISYRKAMAMGIRCKKLPIDNYLAWHTGSKSLCINHVTGILLDVIESGGDWRAAFTKHIPKRKIKPLEVLMAEDELRMIKSRQKKFQRKQFSLRDDLD